MPSSDVGARAELHLHSRASTDTGSWFLNRGALPESFTAPETAYQAAKAKGMDFVAITDHNTLAGVAEIAHHPDVIVGVEVTAGFPDDEELVHVLVWGLDDAQWAEIDYLRSNLFEMLDYVRAVGLPHSLAHPLHRVGGHLSADHLEQLMLSFATWEGRNGARPQITNEIAARIARSATADYLDKLSEKHGIPAVSDGTIALTGGSDDHSGFDIANAWTETPPASSVAELLDHLRAGRTNPGGADGTSQMLAHSVSTLFVKAHIEAGAAAIPLALRGVVGDLVGFDMTSVTMDEPKSQGGRGQTFAQEVMGRLRKDRRLVRQYRKLGRGKQRHERLRLVTGWLHEQLVRSAVGNESGPITSSFSRRLESAAGAAAMAMPYFVAASYMRGEIGYARKIGGEFFGDLADRPARAAMLTDTYDEINGVAGTMRRLAAFAGDDRDERLVVVTPSDRAEESPGLVRLRTASSMQMPAYDDPGWRLGIPSVLDLLDLVEEREIDVIHAATPGPLGIGGLIVARSLGIPFVASYHTELGRYALDLTGDRFFAQLAAKAVGWFYRQAELVYTPTDATAEGLVSLGIERDRIRTFTRGVDTELFDPARRSRWNRRKLGAGGDDVVVLYVGRLSKEKALNVLADAFRRVSADRPEMVLALVGEGPGREDVAKALEGTRHKFLGPLTGTGLASAFASADIFCLPSETETFGQVSMEAAASGLPVIVVDRGGAKETIVDGRTGIVTPAGDPVRMAEAIARLTNDAGLRRTMGEAGVAHARSRQSWNDVFEDLASSYESVRHTPQQTILAFEPPQPQREQSTQ